MTEIELLEQLHHIKKEVEAGHSILNQVGYSNNDTVAIAKRFQTSASCVEDLLVAYMPCHEAITKLPEHEPVSSPEVPMDDDNLLKSLETIENAMKDNSQAAMKLDWRYNPNTASMIRTCIALCSYVGNLYVELCTVEYLMDFVDEIGEPVQNKEPAVAPKPQIEGQFSLF